MLEREKLRRADVVTAGLLAALGVSTVSGALGMPLGGTYGGVEITWHTSPAFFPLLVGALLVLCAVGILVRALRDGGGRQLVSHLQRGLRRLPRSQSARRILTVWALLAAYILLLSLHPFGALSALFAPLRGASLIATLATPEGTNYVLSSALFLALFTFIFYRPGKTGWTRKAALLALLVCFAAAWLTAWVFTEQLYSPLPW